MTPADLAPRRRIGRVALGDLLHRAARRFGARAALIEALPMPSTGKIQKFALRQARLQHFEDNPE